MVGTAAAQGWHHSLALEDGILGPASRLCGSADSRHWIVDAATCSTSPTWRAPRRSPAAAYPGGRFNIDLIKFKTDTLAEEQRRKRQHSRRKCDVFHRKRVFGRAVTAHDQRGEARDSCRFTRYYIRVVRFLSLRLAIRRNCSEYSPSQTDPELTIAESVKYKLDDSDLPAALDRHP